MSSNVSAMGFFDQLLAEAKAAIQDVHSKADARVKRTIREADERVTQLQADAENEIGRLQNEVSQATRDIDQLKADADKRVECVKRETDARVERTIKEADERVTHAKNEIGRLQNKLSQATRDIDQLKADADKRVECVKRETDARVASMETSAKKRIDVIQRENEDKVLRLETDLTQAKNRTNRAEQWVMLFHHEIEHRLMPSVTAMRAGPKSSNPAVSSGLLTVRTVSRSPVRTWFRRLWLQISATAAFGSRAADMARDRPRSFFCEPHQTARCARPATRATRSLRVSPVCRGRRSHELRRQPCGQLSSRRYLCRPDSQRREARRPAGPAVRQG
jgi:hypothetical protein